MAEQAVAPAAPQAPSDQTVLERLTNFYQQQEPQAVSPETGQPVQNNEEPLPEDASAQAVEGEEAPLEEAPAADEPGSITIDPTVPMFDVTVKTEGGKDEARKVSLEELEAGYMRKEDYYRKTQEVAKSRETLTAEVQKIIEPERQQYVQTLGQLQQIVMQMVAPELNGVDMEKLSADDPAQYVRLAAKAQKIQQAVNRIQQEQQAAQEKSRNEVATMSRKMLSDPVEGIQGWNDQMYQDIITKTSKALGFHPDEVAQVVDYRMLKTLHYAQKYLDLQASKPELTKKLSVAPKVLKPGRPAEQSDTQAKTEKELSARLRKTGDIRDAQALYLSRQSRNSR